MEQAYPPFSLALPLFLSHPRGPCFPVDGRVTPLLCACIAYSRADTYLCWADANPCFFVVARGGPEVVVFVFMARQTKGSEPVVVVGAARCAEAADINRLDGLKLVACRG